MIEFTWDTGVVFCWPRVICAVGLEGGCWGTGTEEIRQLQPCEGSI